jgi:hypothetical protein
MIEGVKVRHMVFWSKKLIERQSNGQYWKVKKYSKTFAVRASLARGWYEKEVILYIHTYLGPTRISLVSKGDIAQYFLKSQYKIGLSVLVQPGRNGKSGKPGIKILPKLFKGPDVQSANKQQRQNLPPTLSGLKLNNNTQQPTTTNN